MDGRRLCSFILVVALETKVVVMAISCVSQKSALLHQRHPIYGRSSARSPKASADLT
jgi:hypothetical protein